MSENGLTSVEGRLIDARLELTKRVWGDQEKLFNHAVLCSVGLPYRDQGAVRSFERSSGATSLRMEAGSSPMVEVEDSFTGFARALGLSTTGRNLRTLREQVRRMSCVSMRLSKDYGDSVDVFQGHIFSKMRATYNNEPNQKVPTSLRA